MVKCKPSVLMHSCLRGSSSYKHTTWEHSFLNNAWPSSYVNAAIEAPDNVSHQALHGHNLKWSPHSILDQPGVRELHSNGTHWRRKKRSHGLRQTPLGLGAGVSGLSCLASHIEVSPRTKSRSHEYNVHCGHAARASQRQNGDGSFGSGPTKNAQHKSIKHQIETRSFNLAFAWTKIRHARNTTQSGLGLLVLEPRGSGRG